MLLRASVTLPAELGISCFSVHLFLIIIITATTTVIFVTNEARSTDCSVMAVHDPQLQALLVIVIVPCVVAIS